MGGNRDTPDPTDFRPHKPVSFLRGIGLRIKHSLDLPNGAIQGRGRRDGSKILWLFWGQSGEGLGSTCAYL